MANIPASVREWRALDNVRVISHLLKWHDTRNIPHNPLLAIGHIVTAWTQARAEQGK